MLDKKNKREQLDTKRFIHVMILFVVICCVFVAGFVIRGNGPLMERMGMSSLAVDTAQNPGLTISGNTADSLAPRVAEVQGVLEESSFDTYQLDTATTDVLNAFAESTEDSYVRYYDSAEYAVYKRDVSKNYFGVGVLFGAYQNEAYAVDIFEGSPAQAEGVQPGDFVVAVDGERRGTGWTLVDVINSVERNEGASVVITWRRPASIEEAGGTEFTTTLKCSKVEQENVSSELIDDVGYISIRQLGRTTTASVESSLIDLRDRGARAFTLDLRDVPGGYLTQAVNIASLFQPSGVVVQIQTRDATTNKTATGSVATTAPLTVLVNGNTSAAAEVLAAALQDSGRAQVVGSVTMGKGSVQAMRELSFGGAISYTAAYYLTPLGRTIDGSGISPDISVDEATSGTDAQKTIAVETAAARVTG